MDILDLAEQGRLKRVFLTRNKLNQAGIACHITQHACGSEPLFIEEGDRLYFLNLLKSSSQHYGLELFAFCLMPNHLHLLLQATKDNLPRAMGSIFQAYAIYFNKKYKRKGHVFSGAYRQAICLDERYFIAASAYIHLNPYRAGITDDFQAYRWSSCSLYTTQIKETFMNYRYILAFLDDDISKAQEIYAELLNVMANSDIGITEDKNFLSAAFKQKALRIVEGFGKFKKDNQFSQGMLSDREIENKINELKTKKRLRSSEGREARKFLIRQLKARGYKVSEIAEILTLSRQAISNTLNSKA